MPIYDYRCGSCGNQFSQRKKISEMEAPLSEPCPECEKKGEITKIITSAPVVGYSIAPSLKTTDNFNSRLKEMKSKAGKGNTFSDSIR
tara:strand:+ start:16627 stop:16890 length:264 start_codon:yes stop_codon:yes gene_type:complete